MKRLNWKSDLTHFEGFRGQKILNSGTYLGLGIFWKNS